MDAKRSSLNDGLALISKGWREVRESATNDLKLMKSRSSSLMSIADREISEFEFVKRFEPKISEFKRNYYSAWEGLDRKSEKSIVRIDLSGIMKAFEEQKENIDVNNREKINSHVPIKRIKTRWKDTEHKNLSSKVLDSCKGAEFVEKIKPNSSLVSTYKEPQQPKEEHAVSNDLDLRIGFKTNSKKLQGLNRKRHFAIITTASLPWLTGTAVNPLFRAAYLQKMTRQNVTLLIPWLIKSDQELVYPNNITFENTKEQEGYIRNWLQERLTFKPNFKILFYPGKFSKERRSIMPSGDICELISNKEADIAILEEPEHLNWYHHGTNWTHKFNHVIGIIHTNYLEYIKREKNGPLQAFFVRHVNSWVTRVYCHKVLRLSAATQDLPRSVICNVHGVNNKFLMVGEKIASEIEKGNNGIFTKGAYFLGKMVWAKGYRELIDLLSKHKNELQGFSVDLFGNGEDSIQVQFAARNLDLNVNFFKARDHSDISLHSYKVFINPSVSDVLCTATAEALAMGKMVICADHPSNQFFKQFPNCLTYGTSNEFVTKLKLSLTHGPHPLTPDEMYKLSWEAATQRFLEYSGVKEILRRGKMGNRKRESLVDGGLAMMHYWLTGSELLRGLTGAVPGTRDSNTEQLI